MRPKKTRWVKCAPGERCFKPLCRPLNKLEGVYLSLDEFEAVRLACLEGLKQIDAAKLMKVSRPTFSRILTSAQKKIADGLVNIKAIRIEGGCCKIRERNTR
ncbi:MAG: DUF134 domain-containing protein [Candidatus Omnitrophica bacterium]|nr:DUF134 domain-containing protein [Candidatus Omnitrophota bacterium]